MPAACVRQQLCAQVFVLTITRLACCAAGMPKVLQDWVDYEAEMKLLSALPGQVRGPGGPCYAAAGGPERMHVWTHCRAFLRTQVMTITGAGAAFEQSTGIKHMFRFIPHR